MGYNQICMNKTVVSVLLPLLVSATSYAGLGDREGSVEHDRRGMSQKAVREEPEVHEHYIVHKIKHKNRELREFTNLDGVIFAISWSGNAHPDLSALLGSHWNKYDRASRKGRGGGHRRRKNLGHTDVVQTPDIVVEKGGHMRAIRGRAYIQSLIPEGVSLDEIQ